MESLTCCPICWDAYHSSATNQARCLPCGHTLCAACLGTLLKSLADARNCPACRAVLPDDQLSSFPRVYALEKLSRQVQSGRSGWELSASDLELANQVLGQGATTRVQAGRLCLGKAIVPVAVKILAAYDITEAAMNNFKQEMEKLQAVQACTKACRVFGYCLKQEQPCLVMLRYKMSLLTMIEGNSLPLSKKADIALQLAQAVQQVHSLGFVHLDIKPQNVLLDQYNGVYLSDFGAAVLQQTLSHCMPSAGTAVNGTVNYMSPETVCSQGGTLTAAADIWSLAATILHVFAGAAPFSGISVVRIIASLNEKKKPSIPRPLPAGLHFLLFACFQCMPAYRPDIAAVLKRLQEVAKDIETSAMQAKMEQERQARLGGSLGMRDFTFGSTASHRPRQGMSAFGRPGMSTPLSELEMPALPAFPSFMDVGHNGIYDWGSATDSPDAQAALHAAAEGRLRRPPRVFVAQANTVRAATGSGRSAPSAQASADSADVSGQQTQDAEGGNDVQSAPPNAASSSAPVTGVAATTGEAAVAANKPVLMIQSSAESNNRMCYYPEDRESVFALGSAFTTTALDEGHARAAFYDVSPAPLHNMTYQEDRDNRLLQERQAVERQAASQNDNGVGHRSADTV